jgi:hypothetical protein
MIIELKVIRTEIIDLSKIHLKFYSFFLLHSFK